MGNLQSSPSSSNTTLMKKYDVFLSFRGEDTRYCFTSHLYEALRRKQIETFIDYRLIRGDEISPALMKAIKESKISVVIFSEDYAASKWCLRELVEILKCKEMNNQIVLPIFYRVDPSHVRHQTGSFKNSFVKHEKELQEKVQEEEQDEVQEEVQTWRKALTKASKLSGWHSSVGRTDATLVDDIVNDIWKKLMSEYVSPDFGKIIGLERIKQVISLLCLHDRLDIRIIGIWGMGGIGKTTLADVIFNKYSNQFEGACFIQNVRERLKGIGGLASLQKEILSKVLKEDDLKLDGPTIPPKIKERLNRIKVFIVLDDVDDFIQMETLVKGVGGLGQGSRIIITSRDKQVLRNCRVNDDNIYEVKVFNYHEALQLFCNFAFDENCHSEDLMVMVNQLVNFTKGSPLALKVLGSLLYKKSKQEWESVVNKFKLTNLSRGICDVLKISYDGLTDLEKDIFLDIACFLKGSAQDYVAKILDDCHYSLRVLIDKSLITISSDHKIEMHDLLEEMGRDIVHKESPNEIGKRSRLWRQEDVLCTLTNDDGTPEVQGIVLDMNKINKVIHLSPQVFKKMYNLRLLKFYNYSKVNCSEDLSDPYKLRSLIRYGYPLQAPFYNSTYSNYSEVNFLEGSSVLSDKLRMLIWYEYPLQALPSNFNPNNLVELDLRGSNLERLWEDCKDFPKLRWLNLSGCTRVTKISDLSKSSLLESITLYDCSSLLDFPQLAQRLENLRYLDRRGCNSLRSFPSDIHFESLTSLNLSNCNNLTKFGSQISGNNIARLDLSGTAIKELHHSISHLNGLVKLFLSRCKNLETLPSSICKLTSLRHLDLSGCSRLKILPENLGNLKFLEYLSMKRAAVKELPNSIAHLNGLEELFLGGCKNLETLPSGICNLTSLRHLDLSDCSRLEILPENLGNLKSLEYLSADRVAICQLPYSINKRFPKKIIRFPRSSGLAWPYLTRLFLSDCNLNCIPEDIGCLSSLVELDLSVNNFDGLPQSMMDLHELVSLQLDNCNGIVSLIYLPPNLTHLSACDCKQLQSLPNELDLPCESIFTNCMELEETAVGNMLARLVKYRNKAHSEWFKGFSKSSLCYPGSKVPKWFKGYPTEGSSIKFQETFDCNIKGFAVCAVIAFEKYLFNGDSQHKLGVHFHGTCSDGDQRSPTNIMSETAYFASRNRTLIDSDHVAFGYCFVNYRFESFWDLGNFMNNSNLKNYSFEFQLSEWSPNYRLKSCGVCPIYVQDYDADEACTCPNYSLKSCGVCPIYVQDYDADDSDEAGTCPNYKSCGVLCPIYVQDYDADDSDEAGTSGSRFDEEEMEPHLKENVEYAEPIEHIGETSEIRRSRTSNDHLEEEVEPHPKENKNLQTVKYAEPIENIGETSGIRRSRTSNDHLEEEVEPHPKRLNI